MTPHSPTHHPPWFLFLTAFITGAVVMALEILGSRLLAPVFGNSLFVWGALIGVILAAMSSGYAFGGWISDRRPGGQVLAGLLLISGGWTFLIAWIGQVVLFKVAGALDDPRWGPCLAAAVLLGPPAFGLSGVLPAMLRLAVSDLDHLGRHTGRMLCRSRKMFPPADRKPVRGTARPLPPCDIWSRRRRVLQSTRASRLAAS